jgi:hypothetical protein
LLPTTISHLGEVNGSGAAGAPSNVSTNPSVAACDAGLGFRELNNPFLNGAVVEIKR